MSRKFYKTTFTIEVLSEEPLGDELTLSQIDYAITEGPCVGFTLLNRQEELTSKQMADALYEAGSDPGFFQLDDDGNEKGDE